MVRTLPLYRRIIKANENFIILLLTKKNGSLEPFFFYLIVILFLNGILDVIVDELSEGFIGFVLRVQAVGEDLLVLLRPREHIYRLKTVFLGDLL